MPGAKGCPFLTRKRDRVGVDSPESPTENEMKSWHGHQGTVSPLRGSLLLLLLVVVLSLYSMPSPGKDVPGLEESARAAF